MGKLIKNHWARLIILTAAACEHASIPNVSWLKADKFFLDQIAASLEGFFWPKVFWDFLTTNLDGAVRPIPILQVMNLIFGLCALAWEYPLPWIAGTTMHRSIEARLILYPVCSLTALLLYQGTNPGIYYLIGLGVYFWAFSEGEVSRIFPGTSMGGFSLLTRIWIGCLSASLGVTATPSSREGMSSLG